MNEAFAVSVLHVARGYIVRPRLGELARLVLRRPAANDAHFNRT